MPSNFLKKIEPRAGKEFQKQKQNKMSCHLCFNELEFHEIAGYNPNLPPFSEDRTNFCWEDEEQTTTAPICDACYWAEGSEDEDAESADESEELPVYSFCRECSNPIEQISAVGLNDEELNEEMYGHICDDCNENPSTPPKRSTLQQRSVSPSSLPEWGPTSALP